MGYLFLMDEKKKERAPPSAVDGLLGIEKRVGSWGKKKVIEKGKEKRKRRGASTSEITFACDYNNGVSLDRINNNGFENLLTLGVRVVHFA
jgi:hypothetical protein